MDNKIFLISNLVLLGFTFLLTIVFSLMTDLALCDKYIKGAFCGPPDINKTNENQYCDDAKKIYLNTNKYNNAKNLNLFIFILTILSFIANIGIFIKNINNENMEKLYGAILFAFASIFSFIVLIYWGHYYNNCVNINYKCNLVWSDRIKNDNGKFVSTPQCVAQINKKVAGEFSYIKGINAKKHMSIINSIILIGIFVLLLHQLKIDNTNITNMSINAFAYVFYAISSILYFAYQGNKHIKILKIFGVIIILIYSILSFKL